MIETKFKQTEVGLIPEDWKVVSLGKVISFLPNNTLSRDYLSKDGLIKNIHYGDVLIKYGAVLDVSNTCIPAVNTKLIPSFTPNQYAKNGDIIIADTAEDDTVCKTTELFNIKSTKVVSGLHTMWGRPESGIFISKYLGYFMNSAFYHNQVLPLIQGTKVSSVAKSAIKSTILVLPPATEQSNIANVLTDIDSLLLSLDNLITKKKAIKEGAMQQLLTGKKRLKGFDEPWVEKKIGDCLSIGNGRDYKHLTKGNVPVYGTGGLMCYVSDYLYNGETVCIGRKGTIDTPFFHKGRIWTVDTLFFTHSFIGVVPKYTYYLFTQIKWKELNEATGVPSLNKNNILSVKVKLPTLLEQQAIAQVLTNMDIEISALEAKRKKYESVKQGMMQQLLTGKIRLTSTPKRETLFFS